MADFGSAVRLGISQKQGPKPQSDTQQQSDQGQNNKDNDTIFGGTVDFASPEILKGTSISKLTISSDLWSLGCIFHALLTGSSPFHAATDALAIQSIMEYANGSEKPSFGPDSDSDSAGTYSYSEGWKELIWGLLHPQPEKRLGATENDSPPIGSLIPCFDSIDLDNDPPFLPPESKWVIEARCTEMRDGSEGWSSFLL